MSMVGLFMALSGYNGLISILSQPFFGWLSDQKGRKPLITFGNIQFVLALSFLTMVSTFKNWLFFIPALISLGLMNVINPAMNAAIAESVDSKERSIAYSTIMFYNVLPMILISAFAGLLSDTIGFSGVFLIGTILQIINTLLTFYFIQETLEKKIDHPLKNMKKSLRMIFTPERKLHKFILIIALDAFFWGVSGDILSGLLSETYGFSGFQLGIMWSVLALSWAGSQLFMGKFMQKSGCKRLLVFSELIGIVLMMGWLSADQFEIFTLLQILWGIVISSWVPAMNTILANQTKQETRAEELGKFAAFRGLIAFSAPYIGGFLYDTAGFKAPITFGVIGLVITLVFINLLIKDTE